ncbi:MAG: hypothetical protein ACK559_16145, partial [bacterium]
GRVRGGLEAAKLEEGLALEGLDDLALLLPAVFREDDLLFALRVFLGDLGLAAGAVGVGEDIAQVVILGKGRRGRQGQARADEPCEVSKRPHGPVPRSAGAGSGACVQGGPSVGVRVGHGSEVVLTGLHLGHEDGDADRRDEVVVEARLFDGDLRIVLGLAVDVEVVPRVDLERHRAAQEEVEADPEVERDLRLQDGFVEPGGVRGHGLVVLGVV